MSNGLPIPKWLTSRVLLWQRRLNLDTWTLVLHLVEGIKEQPNAGALTSWARNYHTAHISFKRSDYDDRTPREMDLTIVHELYHLLAAREDDAVEAMVGSEGTVYKGYSKEQEHIADAFAAAIVKAYARKREA